MTEPKTTLNRLAEVVSELGGPSPLLLVGLLQVGLPYGAIAPTLVGVVTMAIVPYLATIWMSRAGRLSDRFIADRKQRAPILVATLVLVILGAVAIWLMKAPPALTWLSLTAAVALVIITPITLVWKISIHATIAAFFAGLQIQLYGPIGLVAVIVPLTVAWARHRLRAHTPAQLLAGLALGALLAWGYAAVVSASP